MNRLCARRRRWTRVSAWVAAISGAAAIGSQVWIVLYAPHVLAAISGLGVLCMWVGIACTAGITTFVLRVTESPAVAAILKQLAAPKVHETKLRAVDSQARTGR